MNSPIQKTLSEISKAGAQMSIHRDTLKITPVSVLPQGIVESVRENKYGILELLQPLNSFFACDHSNNYINVSGLLKEDKEDMLLEIDDFLKLAEEKRQAHSAMVGSRI